LKGELMRLVRRVLPALLALFAASTLHAQRDLGTITGSILDSQGAAIANAQINITEVATGQSFSVISGDSGEYARPLLKPGTYTVTAEAAGFRRAAQQNVEVRAGERVGVNLTLSVGDINQSIEVTTQAPLLRTEDATLGADINTKAVSQLPLGGQRVFAFLARMAPGVVAPENGARDAVGGGFSANGVRSNGQNNFLLNGVDNNVNVIDFINQTAYVIGPSVEAISEMRVLTNGYNAEYGRGAGGVVNVVIKSGTNEVHGALFENLQNEKLNANRWENNKAGRERGAAKQNQFGGAIGFPIIKNKLFMFGDYQGTRVASRGGAIPGLGASGFRTIPTPAMKNGDFSSVLTSNVVGTDALNRPIFQGQIYDPATTRTVNGQLVRDPFPGNIIPVNRFDPAARRIMALFPDPNQAVPTGRYPQNNYFASTPGSQVVDQGDGRVDYQHSDKDSIFGSVSISENNRTSVPPLPGALDAGGFNGVNESTLGRNAMISWVRVWSPTIITETRAAFSRLVTARTGANSDTDSFAEFGIGGYNPIGPSNGGLPSFGLNRYSGFGGSNWLPTTEYNNVWDFIQNVAITKSGHAIKFGAEYRPIKFPFYQVPYSRGEMIFSQNDTSFPSVAAGPGGALNTTTGDEMASFLLGQVNTGQISTTNFISSQKEAWAFYGQDDWKVTPKLTINYGLRYELFSPIAERFGRQSNFVFDDMTLYIPKGPNQDAPLPPNFAQDFPNVKVSRGEVDKYMIPWDKTNFAPRIGFAYSLGDNTVIRSGYGLFYGGEENQGGNPNRGESVPFNQTSNLDRTGVGAFDPNAFLTGGLAGGFPSNVFSLPAPVSFRGVATNFRNGMVHKWNFAIQRQLPGQNVLELAYVGNHQAKQLFQPDWNACVNVGTADPARQSCNNANRPVPFIGGISGTASFGYGNYHGMTAQVEKRLSSGVQYRVAYTYGHALANTGTTLSGAVGFGIPDPRDYSSGYSSAAWDIRHNLVSSFLWEMPFGRGRAMGGNMNTAMNTVLGGWQLNAIISLSTGNPFTLRSNGCQGIWGACRPDLVPGRNPQDAPEGGRTPDKWFDTGAITPPAPLTGGNLGLQSNTAPPYRNLDMSLFKDFPVNERWRVQFRAESFNLTNTPQFGTPGHERQNVNFGQITSTRNGTERKAQFALRLQF
jgi:hypothetical protein